MSGDIVLISINDWSADYFPQKEPFFTWLTPNYGDGPFYILRDDKWCRENKIVVCECFVDQSCNFNITASRKWVEKICPCVLETEFDLTGRAEPDKTRLFIGHLDGHFLPYAPANYGYWFEETYGIPEGQTQIKNDAGRTPVIITQSQGSLYQYRQIKETQL